MSTQAVRNLDESFRTNIQVRKKGSKSESYYTILKYFAGITQFLTWPIAYAFFNLLFKIKINGRENLRNIKSPFIIISNHVLFYDSFLFRLILGFNTYHLPLRFMAVKDFSHWYLNFLSKIRIVDIVYGLFGVFVVYQGRGIHKNLEEAVRIIKNNGNVVIYPEGSVISNGKVENFKHGASVLAKMTGATVIPISMKLKKGKLRREFIINIGRDIKYNESDSSKEITRIFHKVITKLHSRD